VFKHFWLAIIVAIKPIRQWRSINRKTELGSGAINNSPMEIKITLTNRLITKIILGKP
jgi:hypothetical protein